MKFRPCIDLHQGVVKQIVGSTLNDETGDRPETNFQSAKPASFFAELYRSDGLTGGHIIQLGPDNEAAATSALNAWPEGMQIGGGINGENAKAWLDRGASAIIVTSWVFHDGTVDEGRLATLQNAVGKERLVLDLSCRKQGEQYKIVTNRWQTFTDEAISPALLGRLAKSCGEFLIHAVDVEGKRQGIETKIVDLLGQWGEIPMTYAGGIRSMTDIDRIGELGRGQIDFTVGSALDIFGGHMAYKDLAARYGPKSIS
jgi:phosphoribosylformimino-5-aminoimidazole carboxamide ribotide isomerase